jgi:hypothetical protein
MKKLIVCLVVLALVGSASARTYYSDGAVHNFVTHTSDSIGINDNTTVNIGDGVTVTLTREATYATSFVAGYYASGPGYLNLSGSGQLTFSQEMALTLADGPTGAGYMTMSGTSYANPSCLYLGMRADATLDLSDDAELAVRTDGTLYTPDILFGNQDYGYALTATINQSGNSILSSLGSALSMGANNTAIYNMSGGLLDLGGGITGLGTDDAFNYSGGTIRMLGNHLGTLATLNDLTGGAVETFDGTHTTIIPEPMTICLLGLGGLLLRRKR